MRCLFAMFVTAVCFLFLLKLKLLEGMWNIPSSSIILYALSKMSRIAVCNIAASLTASPDATLQT